MLYIILILSIICDCSSALWIELSVPKRQSLWHAQTKAWSCTELKAVI